MPPLPTQSAATTMSLAAFTPAVQAVLAAAQARAEQLHHDFVETEHLLAALLESPDPGVQATMRNGGVPVLDVQAELANYLQPSAVPGQAAPAFAVQVKQVLSAAVEEAQRALLPQAGPMHLLLGLVRVTDGRAAHALARFQVTTASLAPFRAPEPAPAAPATPVASTPQPVAAVPPPATDAAPVPAGDPAVAQAPGAASAPPPTTTLGADGTQPDPARAGAPDATPGPASPAGDVEPQDGAAPAPAAAGVLSNYTTAATSVLSAAAKHAKEHKLTILEPEEILLAIAEGVDPGMTELLASQKVDGKQLAELLVSRIQMGTREVNALTPALSPRTKRVLEGADAEAKGLGALGVDPVHLLLALLRLPDGVAAEALKQVGLSYDAVRTLAPKYERGVPAGSPGDVLAEAAKENLLTKYGEDLTAKARDGKLDVVIGRQHQIEQCVSILSRRLKNNPVILGEAGVGKTALVEGLAQLIVSGGCPDVLKGKRIVQLNLTALISGASHRGEFEERMEGVIREVKGSNGEVILFIDEIHTILGSGGGDGTMSAANILKPALSRGELRLIGATTTTEYKKSLEKDPALQRRFQRVVLDPPSVELTVQLLGGLRPRYESYHHVKIPDDSLEVAARLSDRYIQERYLPDKAVDLVDQAAAEKHLPALSIPQDISDQEAKVTRLTKEVATLAAIGADTRAKKKQRELDEAQHRITDLKQQLAEHETSNQNPTVTPDDIMRVISTMTGIPVSHLRESEAEKLLHMEDRLHERVIGQGDAIHLISEAVRRSKAGLKNPKQPIGSFVFLGPTGVGKTELAKTVAEFLFGSEQALVRFDMSEFQEKHSVARLIGAPPGYVGYDEGGQLTEAIRARPYSVVLFDEIEKAHSDIFDILLQLLDDGRLTDSQGRTVDFKNTIVICTSNIGARDIQKRLGALAAPDALTSEEQEDEEKPEETPAADAPKAPGEQVVPPTDAATPTAAPVADAATPGATDVPQAPTDQPDATSPAAPADAMQVAASAAAAPAAPVSPFPELQLPKLAPLPAGLTGGVLTPEAVGQIQQEQEAAKEQDSAAAAQTPAPTPDVSPFPEAPTAPATAPATDAAAPAATDALRASVADSVATGAAAPQTTQPADQTTPTPEAPAQGADSATPGDAQKTPSDGAAGETAAVPADDAHGAVGTPEAEKEEPLSPEEVKRQRVIAEVKKVVLADLQQFMRPEMVNRFDEIVIFEPLTLQQISGIVSLIVAGTQERLAEQEIFLEVEQPVKELLARQGFDPLFGARPLKRTCQRELDNALSSRLISGDFKPHDVIVATVKDGHIDFVKKEAPKGLAGGKDAAPGSSATPGAEGTTPADQSIAAGAQVPGATGQLEAPGSAAAPVADGATPQAAAAPQAAAPANPHASIPVALTPAQPQAPSDPQVEAPAPGAPAPAPAPAPAGLGLTFAPAGAGAPAPTSGISADQNPVFSSELPPNAAAAPADDLQVAPAFPSEAPPKVTAFDE